MRQWHVRTEVAVNDSSFIRMGGLAAIGVGLCSLLYGLLYVGLVVLGPKMDPLPSLTSFGIQITNLLLTCAKLTLTFFLRDKTQITNVATNLGSVLPMLRQVLTPKRQNFIQRYVGKINSDRLKIEGHDMTS